MKLVISEFMDESAVTMLSDEFDTRYDPSLVDDRTGLLASLADATAIIVRNRTRVDRQLLESAPRLGVVGRLGVGLDNIDTEACSARHITVIPATGANATAVAEYVIGTAMALTRKAYFHSTQTAAGEWPRASLSNGQEIAGKTLGLIGFGGIGRLTARLATALGMTVIAHDPAIPDTAPAWKESGVAPTPLEGVLKAADIISLHVPLTDKTRNLIGPAALSKMKASAILINTSRGNIVDEPALGDALKRGRLAGAAMDVFAKEPLQAASPLSDAPNLILTPHIAGVTVESNARVSLMIAQRVAQWLREHKQRS